MNMSRVENDFDYGNVAVLMGGTSAERDISLLSGNAVYKGLQSKGINAIKIDTRESIYQRLIDNKIERVFIALHGRDGEDGVIQGFLRMLKIPFTGSDTASSSLAMNKLLCKRIWRQLGLDTADFLEIGMREKIGIARAKEISKELGRELFVKPIREGSSVGMSKIYSAEELVVAIKKAQEYDDVLIEQFVGGREYTISILNDKALPSISMVTPNEFYDYDAKYQSNTTKYFCPSGLNEDDEGFLQEIALNAFDSLGCSGWGRVDFIRDTITNKFMILEANTVPGMTESSLVPKAAKSVGIDFPELLIAILNTSFMDEKLAKGICHG